MGVRVPPSAPIKRSAHKGLALGGIARIGQLQLLQPFLTLAAAGLFLHEEITRLQALVALVVPVFVIIGRRAMRVAPNDTLKRFSK